MVPVLKLLRAAAATVTMDKGASGSSGTDSTTITTTTKSNDYHNEFFSTGRSGRRNAMPDILGVHCTTTTADLPDKLGALTTNDDMCMPGTSSASSSNIGPGTSSNCFRNIDAPSCNNSANTNSEPTNNELTNTSNTNNCS